MNEVKSEIEERAKKHIWGSIKHFLCLSSKEDMETSIILHSDQRESGIPEECILSFPSPLRGRYSLRWFQSVNQQQMIDTTNNTIIFTDASDVERVATISPGSYSPLPDLEAAVLTALQTAHVGTAFQTVQINDDTGLVTIAATGVFSILTGGTANPWLGFSVSQASIAGTSTVSPNRYNLLQLNRLTWFLSLGRMRECEDPKSMKTLGVPIPVTSGRDQQIFWSDQTSKAFTLDFQNESRLEMRLTDLEGNTISNNGAAWIMLLEKC
jgi:hypothetical protein